jgi:hypothetical protein
VQSLMAVVSFCSHTEVSWKVRLAHYSEENPRIRREDAFETITVVRDQWLRLFQVACARIQGPILAFGLDVCKSVNDVLQLILSIILFYGFIYPSAVFEIFLLHLIWSRMSVINKLIKTHKRDDQKSFFCIHSSS